MRVAGDLANIALGVLIANRLRTVLSAIGVAIGVAALILMIAVGRGSAEQVKAHVEQLGGDVLTLRPGQSRRAGSGVSAEAIAFDQSDYDALERQVRGLRLLVPVVSQEFLAMAPGRNWNARFIGTNDAYFDLKRWRLDAGRVFSASELERGRTVCVLGSRVQAELFGSQPGIGQIIRVQQTPCLVIGVLERRGQSASGEDENNVVAMPVTAMQRRLLGNPDLHAFVAAPQTGVSTARLAARMEALLRERRAIPDGQASNFTISDMADVARTIEETGRTLSNMIGILAAVCLAVGGIGIMNVMLVGINERTREIGVRLAVGASPGQIRAQFLLEALLLALAGGALGTIAGLSSVALAGQVFSVPVAIGFDAVLGAVAVACLIGLSFGYAPAARAARIEPVDALRHH